MSHLFSTVLRYLLILCILFTPMVYGISKFLCLKEDLLKLNFLKLGLDLILAYIGITVTFRSCAHFFFGE